MRPPPAPSSSRTRTRWRRALSWGLGAFLLLHAVVNVLLATGLLARVLNPLFADRMQVGWSHGWSVVPGTVHVRELTLTRQEPGDGHWRLDIDRAEVNLSLLGLLRRRFETESLDVQGLRVRIHPGKPRSGELELEGAPWKLMLHGVTVHDVHALEVDEVRLTGITEVTGEMEMEAGQRISIRDVRLKLGRGALTLQGEAMAHVEEGTGGFTLEAHRQGTGAQLDLLSGLTEGRLQLSAALPSFGAMQRLLPRLAGARLEGGAGRVEVDVRIQDGHLAPGSRLKGSGEAITLPVGPLRLRAPWRLEGDVRAAGDEPARVGLRLTLSPVRVESRKGQLLETSEARIVLVSKTARLGRELPDMRMELHAARSNPLDLRVLNAWTGQGFQVESGQASLEGSTRGNPGEGRGTAHLELSTENLQSRWGGTLLRGRVLLDVDARKLGVHRDTVKLDGTRLVLRDVSVRTGKDHELAWNGTLAFPEATLSLSSPRITARFSGSFSNAAPFIALLTDQGSLPHVLSPLLTARDLKVSGDVSMGEDGAKLTKLRARGEGLELHGQADSAQGSTRAVLLVKVGTVPVGVEVTPEGAHLQVLEPQRWYEQRTGEPVN
ncbi:hypothetical protein JRI60_10370 [Archangium violaceum]|uniref:hypothetical protein n=1 Tax=Archangium violaceum TaxID=83451 RepID=UPI001950ECDC|nr:hypothetical protein [Archangium violaceum]QRN99388.1 hypothetical protein JRI60_10370 [Archangium violaceum]